MQTLKIDQGTRVTLHFSIKLDDGSVVDSTFDKQPATFEVGDQNLLESFEKLLHGLTIGDQRRFDVAPEQGFGAHNPNNIQEIERSAFQSEMDLSPGLMVSFADANGNELPGVVSEVKDDIVLVDFNHPLAGRELVFEVEIINVEPVTQH